MVFTENFIIKTICVFGRYVHTHTDKYTQVRRNWVFYIDTLKICFNTSNRYIFFKKKIL